MAPIKGPEKEISTEGQTDEHFKFLNSLTTKKTDGQNVILNYRVALPLKMTFVYNFRIETPFLDHISPPPPPSSNPLPPPIQNSVHDPEAHSSSSRSCKNHPLVIPSNESF